MAKLLIVGGGVSGLAAGILAQKNGFTVEIYEKNAVPGGLYACWTRKNHRLNIHPCWIAAGAPGGALFPLWHALGVLEKDPPLEMPDYSCSLFSQGKIFPLFQDIEKLENTLLALSPLDGPEILHLCKLLRRTRLLSFPSKKPSEQLLGWEKLSISAQLTAQGRLLPYRRQSLSEYAQLFRHPVLQTFLQSAALPGASAASALFLLGQSLSPFGGYLPGGSAALIDQMVKTFAQAGGALYTGQGVERILLSGSKARSLLIRSGRSVPGDYIVCACDPWLVRSRLLSPSHLDASLAQWYSMPEKYPVSSFVTVYLALEGPCPPALSLPVCIPCSPFSLAGESHSYLWTFSADAAPSHSALLACQVPQSEKQCDHWLHLAQNHAHYNGEKLRAAQALQKQLASAFPALASSRLIGAVTPASYHRVTGAYKGSVTGFFPGPGGLMQNSPGTVPGVDNCFLTGQWLQPPGGLAAAVTTAKLTVQRLCAMEHRPFSL